MEDNHVFQINHLGKTFGANVVLKDIDFTVCLLYTSPSPRDA